MKSKSIAVVGSGIAGLASAWLLSQRHRVSLYERNDYLGGHSHTVDVEMPGGQVLAVDTGFMVYNQRNYPNLTDLFGWLGVETQPTDMSFAVSLDQGRLEYAGSDLNGLFAQRANLLRPAFWGMLRDIMRFNDEARVAARTASPGALTLGDYLSAGGYGPALINHYLLPMAAAIWSCPTRTMLEFPAHSFLKFFDNHGLLQLSDRPAWRTVTGGSRAYVSRILHAMPRDTVRLDAVAKVNTLKNGVEIVTSGGHRKRHDEVVLACHADQAVALLDSLPLGVLAVLRKFRYQSNRVLLHTDPALMPVNPRTWSSWNYLSETGSTGEPSVSVTYWMNRLQRLATTRPVLVSLNPLREPRHKHVVAQMSYEHPVFDTQALNAQNLLSMVQGRNNVWLAGSYHGYGFHEDALRSAIDVCERLGVSPPWRGESHGVQPAARAA